MHSNSHGKYLLVMPKWKVLVKKHCLYLELKNDTEVVVVRKSNQIESRSLWLHHCTLKDYYVVIGNGQT